MGGTTGARQREMIPDILQTLTTLEPAARVPRRSIPHALRLSNVVKEFPVRRGEPVRPADGVDLTIARGEFVALLGPSGCGKSTILRLAAGLERPTSGTVRVGGDAPGCVARRHGLGLATADDALRSWATIEANVALPFRSTQRRVDHARVAELLEVFGLTEFANARARHVSDDLRRRASIARALVLQPGLLLLDDPFDALDARGRRRLVTEFRRAWAREPVSTLFATNSVDEAVYLADRVVVMGPRPGRIRTVRTIDFERPRGPELFESPDFRRVADDLVGAVGLAGENGPAGDQPGAGDDSGADGDGVVDLR